MPKRTRSHRLEDISIVEFQRLLPDEWVCRTKDKDYGVDLEVEIFDEQGNATGLLFYVQLKATDKADAERSVKMKLDRLEYLASLDAPSMLVRYCDATKATYFMWISNVFAQIRSTSTNSTTINFDELDAWTEETPFNLIKTVKTYRTIKSFSRSLPLGLTVDEEGQAGPKVFEVKLAISKLQSMSAMVISSDDPERCLPIVLHLQENAITASIDVVASITWEVEGFTSQNILPELVYVLAYMAGRYEFQRQAIELTRIIKANDFKTETRFLASRVAQLAIGDPEVAAEIAQRNRLHSIQDDGYLAYVDALLSSELPIDKRKYAIESFYRDAISDHDPEDKQRVSTIYYSLANFQMNMGSYSEAVGNYNRARKLSGDYLTRPYFLNELAACCFWRRRFKAAARFYVASYELAPGSQVGICAGDALLYSGDFGGAKKIFENLSNEPSDRVTVAEATIKAWLCSWLDRFYQHNELSGTAVLNDRSLWFSVIDQALEDQEYLHALGAALVEAFLCDGDEGLWADAVGFAWSTKDSELFLGTLSCAIWRNGYEVYALFRKNLEKSQIPEDGMEHFDKLASALYELRPVMQPGGVIKRLVGPDNFDSVQEIPAT